MREIMNIEGTPVEVSGNRLLLLNDPGSVWIVKQGSVDVFSVNMKDGSPHGARTHVFSGGEDIALFGMEAGKGKSGIGFIAAGAIGTILLKLSRTRLQELALESSYGNKVKSLLDGWTDNLLSGLHTQLPPLKSRKLEAAGELSIDKEVACCAKEGILWVRHLEGSSFCVGNRNLPLLTKDLPFPLSEGSWMLTADKCTLSLSDTAAYMKADPSWSFLESFHGLLCRLIDSLLEEELSGEAERIRKKLEHDSAEMASALGSFVRDKGPGRGLTAEEAADPLFAASKIVGDALKIKISLPSVSSRDSKLRDPLSNIAMASRFRMRKVLLKEDWWKTNSGPLLAFMEEGSRPVALLQPTAATYVIHDPAAQTTMIVDKKKAAEISPVAFSFYRPFPEGPINLLRLLKFGADKNSYDFNMILLMGVAGGLLGLILPLLTSIVFDSIIPMARSSQLLQIGAALCIGALATAMFDMTRAVAMLRIEGTVDGSVQSALMDRLLSLPVGFFRQYSVGDLSNRTMGMDAIRQLMTGAVTSSLLSGMFSVFSLLLLFYYSFYLAAVAVGLLLLSAVITLSLVALNIRHQRELMRIAGSISGLVFQFISGMAKLRVSGSEKRGFAKWLRKFHEQKECNLKSGKVTASLSTLNSVYPVLCSMLIFLLFLYKESSLSMGEFLSFTAAFSQCLSASIQISASLASVLAVVPMYERAKPLLHGLPETTEEKADPGELSGDIEIKNAVFRYKKDSPIVVQNVSLHINKGEFIAIVGPSGSGKSSLLRLLLGFETPEEGSIYYDRQDIQTLDLRVLRRQIGVVLQNGQLMAGDIFSNIIGSNNLTQYDAWEAARLSGLDRDIEDMPMGMFTMIPPGGSTISGGQRQRLLIARAMVTKPRIFFFDEATSAIDNITQAIVSRSLEQFHATRLVIAHRLSTVINADRIVVMDKGRVVESGTYGELMEKDGLFCELAKRQLA